MYKGKVKISSLVYNQHEIRDKQPLGRDPARSWCHRPPLVFLVTAHGSIDMSSSSMAMTPAPVWVPIQWLLAPSFTSVVG